MGFAVAASQGPWWATPLVGLLGIIIGATTTLGTTFLLDHRKAAREAEAAEQARRREAYMEILTWLARTRDELKRAIEDRRPFDYAFADERDLGRLDALSELAATPEFRGTLSHWSPAFHDALQSYELFRTLPDDDPDEAQARRDVRDQLVDQLKTLQDVIEAVRIRARQDTSPSLNRVSGRR